MRGENRHERRTKSTESNRKKKKPCRTSLLSLTILAKQENLPMTLVKIGKKDRRKHTQKREVRVGKQNQNRLDETKMKHTLTFDIQLPRDLTHPRRKKKTLQKKANRMGFPSTKVSDSLNEESR
jgi:hypothetical protein